MSKNLGQNDAGPCDEMTRIHAMSKSIPEKLTAGTEKKKITGGLGRSFLQFFHISKLQFQVPAENVFREGKGCGADVLLFCLKNRAWFRFRIGNLK